MEHLFCFVVWRASSATPITPWCWYTWYVCNTSCVLLGRSAGENWRRVERIEIGGGVPENNGGSIIYIVAAATASGSDSGSSYGD